MKCWRLNFILKPILFYLLIIRLNFRGWYLAIYTRMESTRDRFWAHSLKFTTFSQYEKLLPKLLPVPKIFLLWLYFLELREQNHGRNFQTFQASLLHWHPATSSRWSPSRADVHNMVSFFVAVDRFLLFLCPAPFVRNLWQGCWTISNLYDSLPLSPSSPPPSSPPSSFFPPSFLQQQSLRWSTHSSLQSRVLFVLHFWSLS